MPATNADGLRADARNPRTGLSNNQSGPRHNSGLSRDARQLRFRDGSFVRSIRKMPSLLRRMPGEARDKFLRQDGQRTFGRLQQFKPDWGVRHERAPHHIWE